MGNGTRRRFENLLQGISADLIATKFGYSRNDVDSFAVTSQKNGCYCTEEWLF
jgi:acetyl-CoA C-acetyltransferase